MSESLFSITTTGEPHAERRAKILKAHPEIRELMGYDSKTIPITVAVVIVQFFFAWVIQAHANKGSMWGNWISVVVASYFVGAVMSHWLAMTIHETSHNLAARTAKQNIALAHFANLPMFLPAAATFRRYHIEHHTFLGVEKGDTDLPHALEAKYVGQRTFLKFLVLFLYLPAYIARGLTFAKRTSKGEWLNGLLMLVVNIAIYKLLGAHALVYLGLSTFFGHSLHPVAAHFIHEHYVFSPGQETYSYYGALNLVTFNVGYHNEHHDFMNVPGSKLPALRKLIPQYYDKLVSHHSWTYVLWYFITDRTMGFGSRIVRSRDSFNKARLALVKARAEAVANVTEANEVLDDLKAVEFCSEDEATQVTVSVRRAMAKPIFNEPSETHRVFFPQVKREIEHKLKGTEPGFLERLFKR